MTAKEGRKRSISCLVAVGNGNGAAGLALGHTDHDLKIECLVKFIKQAVKYFFRVWKFKIQASFVKI